MLSRRKLLILGSSSAMVIGAGYSFWGRHEQIPFQGPVSEKENHDTLNAMRPPKRKRPVIAVLADNLGSETTDFIIPWSVLKRSGVADVYSVALTPDPIQLMPALSIVPDMSVEQFGKKFPDGADYVIVPALHDEESPAAIDWINEQSLGGATSVGICAGALTLAHAGVLDGKQATTHWFNIDDLKKISPSILTQRSRRFVADHGVVTTTGVSASLPLSLKLVEAIAGRSFAEKMAMDLGVRDFDQFHLSQDFKATSGHLFKGLVNAASIAGHEDLGLPIQNGMDELSIAFVADAWSRTYRSQCLTVASSRRIETANGMIIIPDKSSNSAGDLEILPVQSSAPGKSLGMALDEIAKRYDRETASLVALQLEYDWS